MDEFLEVLKSFFNEGRRRVSLQEVFTRYKRLYGNTSWGKFKHLVISAEKEGYWVREDILFRFVAEKFHISLKT
jgi:hypothetical protein